MAKPRLSVSNTSIATRGLFAPHDLISLHSSLQLEGNRLIDQVNDARHRVSEPVVPALRALSAPIEAEEWLAQLHDLELGQAQTVQLVNTLAGLGAFTIRRSWRDTLRQPFIRLVLRRHGLTPAVALQRRALTPLALFTTTARSLAGTWLALVAAVLVWSLLYPEAWLIGLRGGVALWLSVLAHEAAHAWPLRRLQPMILQGGWHMGLLHRRDTPSREIVSAVSGPLAGALACVILLPAPWATAGVILHLLSLLPQTSDGRTLWTRLWEIRA
jgi:small-conductance mechanosensitive channel